MTRFPLLKLPFLAIETVLKQVDFADLIDFTTCSKKCQMTAAQMKHPYTRMEVVVNRRHKSVKIYSENDDIYQLYWSFNPYGKSCHRARVRKVDKMRIRWQKEYNSRFSIITSKHPRAELSMQLIITYLIRIFRVPITKVMIYTHGVDQFPFRFNCESLELYGNGGRCRMSRPMVRPLSNEELSFLLDNLNPTRKIDIKLPIDNTFSYQSFDCDIIDIQYAEWMSGECLLNSRFVRANLENCTLTEQDVINFISKWMDSADKRFEELIIGKRTWGWNKQSFDDLTTEPWDWNSTKRARNYRLSSGKAIDFSTALDIDRSDGLLASVLITSFRIYFVVWNDRFPETDGLEFVQIY